jgi:pimeloyl-ACP methyl ester carboxylesterase
VVHVTGIDNGIRYTEVTPDHGSWEVTYLLVHGLGGSLEHWAAVIEPLGQQARAIAFDIPGFGHSRTALGNFDLELAVGQILRFCQSKGVTEAVLVSSSIGSVVAARLAAIEPALFTRLIFVSGTLVRASQIAQHPRLALSNPRLGFFVTSYFLAGSLPVPRLVLQTIAASPVSRYLALWPFTAHPAGIPPNRVVEALTGSGSLSVIRILLTANSIDYIATISAVTQPVDLIWGAEDHLINNEDLVSTRQMVYVEREHVIQRCGHWPWLEKPSELISFLTSWSPHGTP